jgi:ATP-binding cassette subfamily B protein
VSELSAADTRERSTNGMRPLRRLLPYVLQHKGHIALALLAMLVAAGATLSLPVAVRGMIDHGFDATNAADIDQHFIRLFAVAMVMGISAAARFYWVSWLGERVVADVRSAVYSHVIEMSPEFFERTRTGEVLSRLNTDTTLIQTVVGSSASIALRSSLMLVGAATLLVITSPRLALMMAFVIPLVLVPILVFGRKVRAKSRESQDRIADFSAVANETIGAIQTVQAFTAQQLESSRFADNVEQAFLAARRRIGYRSLLTVSIVLLVFGAISFVLYQGATSVVAGDMSAGTLSQFVLYAVFTASSTAALSEVWGEVQRAAGATERIAELLDADAVVASPPSPVALPLPPQGALSLEEVTFHYPSRPMQPVFEGLTLSVEPGQTVALVGPSGAGKTTIMQLLLRFYDVASGHIRVDGVDVREADIVELRRRFGLVAQESVIFSTSAMENIRYGRPDASDEEVRTAARAANAHEFIETLPEGYDSHLGERGVRLSGGQRQRIAIARALLKDPPILLLDEATSSLDAISEDLVQKALERLMRNRTTLVIAHRLATVKKVDKIVVLEGGRVVAEGNHETLLSEGGLYAELAELQFQTATG